MIAYPFYATPAFMSQPAYSGVVHSRFHHAVNLMLETLLGLRMLTLCHEDAPLVPDSVALPLEALRPVAVGARALLQGAQLQIGGLRLRLRAGQGFTGEIAPQTGAVQKAAFIACVSHLRHGFLRMPMAVRQRVDRALVSAEAPGLLGLGGGLTPAFDDACVGVMAVCRARGMPAPFCIEDVSRTTDVSGRYLRLAQEGYFGEAIGQVMAALFGKGDLPQAVLQLSRIGATSGCDMLYGMLKMLCFDDEKPTMPAERQ